MQLRKTAPFSGSLAQSMCLFFFICRASALGSTGLSSGSPHIEDIENDFFSTMLALCLYVSSGILKDNDSVPLAIGAFNDPVLLRGDSLPGTDDFFHYLGGWRGDSDVFVHLHPSLVHLIFTGS